MDQPIEDGVGHGGVGDDLVPLLRRKLAGHEGRAVAAAVIDDFEEVAVLSWADGGDPQVVDDEDPGFLNTLEQLGEAAVSVSLPTLPSAALEKASKGLTGGEWVPASINGNGVKLQFRLLVSPVNADAPTVKAFVVSASIDEG